MCIIYYNVSCLGMHLPSLELKLNFWCSAIKNLGVEIFWGLGISKFSKGLSTSGVATWVGEVPQKNQLSVRTGDTPKNATYIKIKKFEILGIFCLKEELTFKPKEIQFFPQILRGKFAD